LPDRQSPLIGSLLRRIALSHVIFVVAGIFMMMVGNMLPKMPWLSARFRSAQLDPWQWNRHLRSDGSCRKVWP
jgi:hypothetical protein